MRAGHCTEEDLIALLDTPASSNEHATSCTECRAKLDSFRVVICGLKDDSVWNDTPLCEAPVPQTIANLRAFADRMASEDAQAETCVRDLLEGPREGWMPKLQLHPEYRTAGVVRKLIESTTHAIDTMPPDAVAMTTLATEIADHLDPAAYTNDTVPRLRGAAWRERAYALFYTGAFSDAEAALRASESNLSDCLVNEYELARVGIVRALVERGLENYSPAIIHANASARVFEAYRDATRSASARLAEVHLLFSTGEHKAAYEILVDLKRRFECSKDADTYARVLANLGHCCWALGKSDEALWYHDAAAKLLTELGVHSDAVRESWNVALVLIREGRLDEAVPRLEMLRQEFERLGMTASYTQVTLDLAEILVTRGAHGEVDQLCSHVMRTLEKNQLEHTAPALTALALMQEAARNRTTTPALVRRVRDYLRRMPDEPNLLFALPPE
ncbi:MAG TPA: tetratricopeptide repeat protein [Thermoanaerobaculia bacterium]|nr:tetratricopeptide repeat protein [Thermoanaerobaculia bacterium]